MNATGFSEHPEEMPRDAELRAMIRSHVGELDRRFDCVIRCQVRWDRPRQRDWLTGRRYRLVRLVIECDVPGRCLVVSRTGDPDAAGEDIDDVIHAAFEDMHAELEDHVLFHREEPEAHARHFR